ncbi:AAA family ATPase [Aurantimonas endophytica]|uniref:Exonuclease SbcC n=1 Tax=Aurantimonas endophytica TaxID=1522175 RepID=A0A7W6HF66_9HYPH|nr:AAA family ATPase [Aurantimonas endophytica]MBB4003882.1 exonuclease SbcC [Aurantimonas endophytica]MCO6404732.1 AAA family ATPase [Aurantimonas endophytica]
MNPRLKSLSIQNFRSMRGSVVIPLDAQVVLVHGTNGMGKTSVMSAIELGLTGSIAHLEDQSKYHDFLTHIDTEGGSIQLAVEGVNGRSTGAGRLTFTPSSFDATPALNAADASFFAERCYLPQAVLGRLLDIYDQKKNTSSRLTEFVKELLRLDALDALVDGLDHAFNVTRIRKLAPVYKQLEEARDLLDQQLERERSSVETALQATTQRISRLNELLAVLDPTAVPVVAGFDVAALRARVGDRDRDQAELASVTQQGSEVSSLLSRLEQTSAGSPDAKIAALERDAATIGSEYETWLNGPGAQITQALDVLREFYSELSPLDGGSVEDQVRDALKWCVVEVDRCQRLLDQHGTASQQLTAARTTIQRATTRIGEINQALEVGAKDARTLAAALAGIAPHVEGNMCPVCNRDYAELDNGSLTAHIAATIANLTSEAGRLQALSTERASESERLTMARRDEATAERLVLQPEALVDLRRRQSAIASIRSRLEPLQGDAADGQSLFVRLDGARRSLAATRRAGLQSASLLPEINDSVEQATGLPTTNFSSLREALEAATGALSGRLKAVHGTLSSRVSVETELDQYAREAQLLSDRVARATELERRVATMKGAFSSIGEVRERAKTIATAATHVRSGIVRDVFSGSLNKVWRDLFVRLAPNEQFVPQFRLPDRGDGKVEAVLETFHRSGQSSGPPGAMLSQGNLNTAALTLFLALNLSVPSQLPWLVLDDPVQSMDDVHIAQFAALLRTFSKGLGKQVLIAVHERALFEYLTLELSPAFAGDSLITVEISRNFAGDAVADPHFYAFEDDKAVAA